MIKELLAKQNLKYEDLNYAERETLEAMTEAMQKSELTIPGMKDKFMDLISFVSMELTSLEPPKSVWDFLFRKRKDIALKARLKNYLLLYQILSAPDKAKKMLESQISNAGKK